MSFCIICGVFKLMLWCWIQKNRWTQRNWWFRHPTRPMSPWRDAGCPPNGFVTHVDRDLLCLSAVSYWFDKAHIVWYNKMTYARRQHRHHLRRSAHKWIYITNFCPDQGKTFACTAWPMSLFSQNGDASDQCFQRLFADTVEVLDAQSTCDQPRCTL